MHTIRFIVCSLLLGAGAGCAVSVGTLNDGPDEQDTAASQLFPEDDDPAIGALSFVEDELLVLPYPGADSDAIALAVADAGAVIVGTIDELGLITLAVAEDRLTTVAEQLAATGLFESLHKNYYYEAQLTPNDTLFSLQGFLTQVGAPQAWDISTGDEEIAVAVVDSGIDREHADLADRIQEGWNIYDNNGDFGDVAGHGTLAAGVLAAASNNRAGVTGVTWDCPLIVVRVTDLQGRSTGRHLAAGILWALSRGARVINVSFAPLWSNTVVQAAAAQANNRGSLVVISAGNGAGTTTAAGYAEALFVGAVTATDRIADFSDRGSFVDLVAPGTAIRTTAMGGAYTLANGTSFAAPVVSGVAALAWSANPALRPTSIRSALTETALDLGVDGKDSTFGHGRIDAFDAVDRARTSAESPDVTAPVVRITRPAAGATLSGRTTAVVSASDGGGIAEVRLSVDGIPYATDDRSPFQFVIDTTAFAAGTHTIAVVATDLAGNTSAEQRVSVRFAGSSTGSTAPTVSFRSPADGASVSGNVTISATVSSGSGLAAVEWFVDGESVLVVAASGQSSGVSYVLRTAGLARGAHTVTLAVTDNAGRQASALLNLIVR